MYEAKTSDLGLAEAIDVVGLHFCPNEWQQTDVLKNKNLRAQVLDKFKEIMSSGKVACWYVDDHDKLQEITPSVATSGTISIAPIHGAFSFGREGRWFAGKFNNDDLITYLNGQNASVAEPTFSAIEDFLRSAMDRTPVNTKKSYFLEQVKAHFNSYPGLQRLSDNKILGAWKVVVEKPPYSERARRGRRVGT